MPSLTAPALEYAEIPEYAALLPIKETSSESSTHRPPPTTRRFSLDDFSSSLTSSNSEKPSSPSSPTSPRKPTNTGGSSSSQPSFLTSLLISSAMNIPASQSGSSPRGPGHLLMSTKDPLSIPITTANSRRFVSRAGFLFWTLDRTEEIVMWRKGWKYTTTWIVVYSSICLRPWLLLLVPNVALLYIMLSSYQTSKSTKPTGSYTSITNPAQMFASQATPPALAAEGSREWLANVQGLQNLMGFLSDNVDSITPYIPLLTFKSRASTPLFLFLLFTTFPLIFLPLNIVLLVAGLGGFTLSHPVVLHILTDPNGIVKQSKVVIYLKEQLRVVVNDVGLSEECILAGELHEVSMFQNERWSYPTSSQTSSCSGNVSLAGWKGGSANLKPSDRGTWTKRSDGSVTVGEDSEHIVYELEPGWKFVDSEEWEPDFMARWAVSSGADRDGWVYTNDAWLDPRAAPVEEWQKVGMTRRRRWTRRAYQPRC